MPIGQFEFALLIFCVDKSRDVWRVSRSRVGRIQNWHGFEEFFSRDFPWKTWANFYGLFCCRLASFGDSSETESSQKT